ncbi:hypothetical protein FisN_2Hh248 [Fistulifera solaris]|jgi:hypothetical protein|uniref:Uncharacterized protein n=1 Tax=Fistulifera solaris TaxID=1519565 RepID=A0A1Z5JEJ1_FISSO|nr:hypothetical protein FisN_2Hh248 [Fistulifera solaris]|eukprot:GAX12417.1 hypothetical protein FisN_2Hh248 [Fistulifera solaris]
MTQSKKSDDSFEFTLVSTNEPSTVVVDENDVIVNAEQMNDTHDAAFEEQRLAKAAGIGSAVVGCLVGGPILAVVLGVGAKFACEQPNASGLRDTARAVGEVALLVHHKAKQLDEQYNIVEESQQAAANLWQRAKEADEKHHILEKTKQGLLKGYRATADYVHRHNLIERFVLGVGSAVVWLGDKVALLMAPNNESRRHESNNGSSGSSTEIQRVHLLRDEVYEMRVTE